MSINLNELVDSLIQSAPPAELKQVSQSLSSLTKEHQHRQPIH